MIIGIGCLSLLASCGGKKLTVTDLSAGDESDKVSIETYNELVEKFDLLNEESKESRESYINAGYEANKLSREIQQNFLNLDAYGSSVVKILKIIETKVYPSEAEYKEDIDVLDGLVKTGIDIIWDLEQALKNQQKTFFEEVELYFTSESAKSIKEKLAEQGKKELYNELDGFRELFLKIAYDAKKQAVLLSKKIKINLDSYKFDSSDYKSSKSNPLPASGAISGTVYAQNKSVPVSGALVYLPQKDNEELVDFKDEIREANKSVLACGEPGEDYIVKTCSSEKGFFKIDSIPEGKRNLVIKVGPYKKASAVQISAGEELKATKEVTALPVEADENSEVAKIVVFSGAYDHLEKVLQKLGLVQGKSFTFQTQAAQFKALVNDPEKLEKVDLIMINCGFSGEALLKDEHVKNNLKKYVEGGGGLFITDQAYDIVEQIFPEYIKFTGDPADISKPGAFNMAQKGSGGVTFNAEIEKLQLKLWLKSSVKCNGGDNCLDANDKAKISGFSASWATIESVNLETTEVWVKNSERPLTVMFSHGKGKVFYSSYHTVHGGQSTLVPQERILQYFVYEVIK